MADLIAPMPALLLYYNCTAVFEAIDPTTGVAVSGVTVSNPALYGRNLLDTSGEPVETTPTLALPLFAPIPTPSEG